MKTKRFLLILIVIMLALGLASCSSLKDGVWSADNRQTAEDRFQQIVKAIEEKDAEGLKNLFSPNALKEAENIDDGIAYLFEYFKGDVRSVDHALDVTGSSDHGDKITTIRCQSTVVAKVTYIVFFIDVIEDTEDPDNVGLYMLQIFKESKIDEQKYDWGYEYKCAGVYLPDTGEQEDET